MCMRVRGRSVLLLVCEGDQRGIERGESFDMDGGGDTQWDVAGEEDGRGWWAKVCYVCLVVSVYGLVFSIILFR